MFNHRLAVGLASAAISLCFSISAAMAQSGTSTSYGRFEGPLILRMEDDGRIATLMQPYVYVDGGGRRWTVPQGAQVNGASIPREFWTVLGGPYEGRYRNASVIHDYFCEPEHRQYSFQATHRMFYEGMRAMRVSENRAQLMYYAVRRWGPRWDPPGAAANSNAAPFGENMLVTAIIPPSTSRPSRDELDAMEQNIEENSYSLDDLDRMADHARAGRPW